jgi:thioredoxin 1
MVERNRRKTSKGRAMAGNLLEITDATFDSMVTQSDVPVLVDFWAPWCGPCQMVTPVLEQLATQYEGKVKVGKVNVDENQAIAGQHGITSIPAVILFKDGQRVDELIGAGPKSHYEEMLQRHL